MDSEQQFGSAGHDVVVRKWRLLRVAGVDVQPGGMSTGDSVAHVRVLDAPNARIFLIPVNRLTLQALIGQAEHLLQEDDSAENAENEE